MSVYGILPSLVEFRATIPLNYSTLKLRLFEYTFQTYLTNFTVRIYSMNAYMRFFYITRVTTTYIYSAEIYTHKFSIWHSTYVAAEKFLYFKIRFLDYTLQYKWGIFCFHCTKCSFHNVHSIYRVFFKFILWLSHKHRRSQIRPDILT